MKWLKTYESFDDDISVVDDIKEIMTELEDEGFRIEITFWVNGAKGGFLASNEQGEQLYGPIANDGKLYLKVEVKKIEPPGNFLTKNGFNWIDVEPYLDRLRDFLEDYSQTKYKINTMIVNHVPRFSIIRGGEITDSYQTSFDYIDSKYIDKSFVSKNTVTSVGYLFERL